MQGFVDVQCLMLTRVLMSSYTLDVDLSTRGYIFLFLVQKYVSSDDELASRPGPEVAYSCLNVLLVRGLCLFRLRRT